VLPDGRRFLRGRHGGVSASLRKHALPVFTLSSPKGGEGDSSTHRQAGTRLPRNSTSREVKTARLTPEEMIEKVLTLRAGFRGKTWPGSCCNSFSARHGGALFRARCGMAALVFWFREPLCFLPLGHPAAGQPCLPRRNRIVGLGLGEAAWRSVDPDQRLVGRDLAQTAAAV
jgi:hypothetical protein